jgi:uncharacterized membrane protein YfcA
MMHWIDFANTAAGFFVGLFVGLTGVGGGALMTPILVLLFGVAPATAIGTDLWFAAITKLFGMSVHHLQGSVDWQVFRRLCLGSLPAACLTSLYLYLAGASRIRDGFLISALGVVLIITAVAMLFKEQLHSFGRRLRIGTPERFKHAQFGLTVLAGALLGVMVTLTSIGAGALGATLLLYLYPLRLTTAKLVGTDIAHAIPLAVVAGSGHLLAGNVNGNLLVWLLLGSIPGVIIGARLGYRVPDQWLRGGVAILLGAVGIKMLSA